MCPFGPSHVFLEFRPYNSVAVYGPDQINADDDERIKQKNASFSHVRTAIKFKKVSLFASLDPK